LKSYLNIFWKISENCSED